MSLFLYDHMESFAIGSIALYELLTVLYLIFLSCVFEKFYLIFIIASSIAESILVFSYIHTQFDLTRVYIYVYERHLIFRDL